VHRDVREPNVSCDIHKEYYFWLDLELVCALDNVPQKRLGHWPEAALVAGRYTAQSDIYCLGMVLHKWASACTCPLSAAGSAFLRSLLVPACEQRLGAKELLHAAEAGLAEVALSAG
jgi:hypothetical protein